MPPLSDLEYYHISGYFGRLGTFTSPLLSGEVRPMEDFRDAKSADFLYEGRNVFVPSQRRICDTD